MVKNFHPAPLHSSQCHCVREFSHSFHLNCVRWQCKEKFSVFFLFFVKMKKVVPGAAEWKKCNNQLQSKKMKWKAREKNYKFIRISRAFTLHTVQTSDTCCGSDFEEFFILPRYEMKERVGNCWNEIFTSVRSSSWLNCKMFWVWVECLLVLFTDE